jgi:putative ABC transport system substrate-binding protein
LAAGQSNTIKRLGILSPSPPPPPTTEPFRLRLRAALPAKLRSYGWSEGENLVVERRYAGGDLGRLPALATELVTLNVDVIYATTGTAGLAAKNATDRIPIVTQSGDMVQHGLVSSLARPGGNVTGQNVVSADAGLVAKRLHLLSEVLPARQSRIAVLGCGPDATKHWGWPATESAARQLGLALRLYSAQTLGEIQIALKSASAQADALFVFDCPYFNGLPQETFLRHTLPAMYPFEFYAQVGGLMAYGFDEILNQQRHAWYIDRILRGTKPGELPVEETKPRFVVNLRTAQRLGLKVPDSVLLRADEVIR